MGLSKLAHRDEKMERGDCGVVASKVNSLESSARELEDSLDSIKKYSEEPV